MQTTPAGDLVEHLASYNGRRLFRQHVSRLRHVLVAVPVGLPGQDARVGGTRMAVSPETVRDLDQAPRPRRRLGDASGRDVQAGCQPPGRWGIAAVKRHGAPPPIIVNEGRRRHVHVTADQHALGAGGGAQGGRGEEDAMPRRLARLVEPWRLRETGLEGSLPGRLCAVWPREVGVIDLRAIRAVGPPPGLGAGGGAVQRGSAPERGKQGHVGLSSPRASGGGPAGPVQEHGGPREPSGAQWPPGVSHGVAPYERRGAGAGCRVLVRTARGTPRTPVGPWGCGLRGGRLGLAGGLRGLAAHHLRARPRQRAPGLDTPARQRDDGPPGDRLTVPARHETSQALRARARVSADDVIARHEVDSPWTVHLGSAADPHQEAPREDRGAQALDGAIAAICTRPAGQAQPGHASGPHQESAS